MYFNPPSQVFSASSGLVAAAVATATRVVSKAGNRIWLTSLSFSTGGATAAISVTVTVSDGVSTLLSYIFTVPALAGSNQSSKEVTFTPAIPLAVGRTLTVSMPSNGLGNAAAVVNLTGYETAY